MAPGNPGNRLLAFVAHHRRCRVVQGRGQHRHARPGGADDAVKVIGHDALPVHGDAMHRQTQLRARGFNTRRGQRFNQHRLTRLAQRQQHGEQALLGAGTQHDVVQRHRQAACLEPVGTHNPGLEQVGRAQVMLQTDRLMGFQQPLQGLRIGLAGVVYRRDVGAQINLPGVFIDLLQAEQRRLLAAREHVGAAPDFARHQMPPRRLAISLHGSAGVPAQCPGQPPLWRQTLTGFEFTAADGVGNRVYQRQITRLR